MHWHVFMQFGKIFITLVPDGCDGDIDVLEGGLVVQLNVKMLI
jgi:hypothetical protein